MQNRTGETHHKKRHLQEYIMNKDSRSVRMIKENIEVID